MATRILKRDHAVPLSRQPDVCPAANDDAGGDTSYEVHEEDGNVFRGFFFAMLFNAMLVLTGAAGWELWRLIR
jgi:hypothetical protein